MIYYSETVNTTKPGDVSTSQMCRLKRRALPDSFEFVVDNFNASQTLVEMNCQVSISRVWLSQQFVYFTSGGFLKFKKMKLRLINQRNHQGDFSDSSFPCFLTYSFQFNHCFKNAFEYFSYLKYAIKKKKILFKIFVLTFCISWEMGNTKKF